MIENKKKIKRTVDLHHVNSKKMPVSANPYKSN